jgi:hypothetical protein
VSMLVMILKLNGKWKVTKTSRFNLQIWTTGKLSSARRGVGKVRGEAGKIK